MFKTLSAINAFSLLVFGMGSLLLSIWSWSPVGVAVSLAIFGHGWVEMVARRRLLENRSAKAGRVMIWNQLGLAVSVSLYAAWQLYTTDPESVREELRSPLISQLLDMYPPDAVIAIDAWMPRMVSGFYLLVIAVVWLGCGATAVYYRSAIRRLDCS